MILDTSNCRFFSTGYTGKKPADLLSLVNDNRAVVADIRFSTNSRVPRWRGPELARLLGDRYTHVGSLGNVKYRDHAAGIVIADLEAGLREVLAVGGPVILLCACERAASCHRRVVADALASLGHEVRELQSWTSDTNSLF